MKKLSFQTANTNFEYFFMNETFTVKNYKNYAQFLVMVVYCFCTVGYCLTI